MDAVKAPERELREISLDLIDDPALPIRSDLSPESVKDLADSIRLVGVIEPLIVSRVGRRYQVIAGHRRLVAAHLAGLAKVPCVITDGSSGLLEMLRFHENAYRADVNPVDEAYYLAEVKKRFQLTGAKLAELIGQSPSYVDDRLAILRYPTDVKQALMAGVITFSVAREFARVEADDVRADFLHHAIEGGVTPAVAHQWQREYQLARAAVTPPSPEATEDTTADEEHSYKVMCEICRKDLPLKNAVVLYAHAECRKAVRETK